MTTDRKDKGKMMKPPADATHCGGYPMADTPELFSGLLWHSVPGGVLPIGPMSDNIPMTDAQIVEFEAHAHADALIYAAGYRKGLEAAAVVADEYFGLDSYCAAAIRAMKEDTP